MKSEADYEQLYYDSIYENRKLKQRIEQLENEIQDINRCRTKRNVDLQKYIMLQIERKKNGIYQNNRKVNKKM